MTAASRKRTAMGMNKECGQCCSALLETAALHARAWRQARARCIQTPPRAMELGTGRRADPECCFSSLRAEASWKKSEVSLRHTQKPVDVVYATLIKNSAKDDECASLNCRQSRVPNRGAVFNRACKDRRRAAVSWMER
jgi:hypothetical protein